MESWRKYRNLITRDMVIKAIESSDDITTDGRDDRFLIWEEKEPIPAKKLLRRAAELAFPNDEIDWNGAGGDPTVEILTALGFELKSRDELDMEPRGVLFSVNDSIWIAAAAISYEKYYGDAQCRNIADFILTQREIRDRARAINQFEPEAARTSQWCCGDHGNHTYAYLRAIDSKRRLSFPDEFSGDKCEPTEIDTTIMISTSQGEISIQKLYDFVHTEYAEMADQVVTSTSIDYIGVLDYLRDNQEIPYSNPDAEGIDEQEKARLLEVKEKGQAAVGEMKKMAIECQKVYKLDKCLPISWLDGSNTKTRKYLWAQMKYSQYADDPTSISIFVEKNGENSSRYRISLELKNDGTDKKTVARFHSYLDKPINFSAGLVMASGSNEWGHPQVINDTQENVKAQVDAGKLRKVQLCKYIERKPDETNDYFHEEFIKAVGLLIPYYEHVLGIKPVEWWPSKDEYDPGLTVEQWVEILNDPEITTDNNLRMFAEWLDYGKPAACSEIADYFGETKNFFNAGSSAMAKRIVDKGKCPAPPFRDNENARWWPVLYVGHKAEKQEKGSYVWKLRDEVKQALEQVDLPEIGEKVQMSENREFGLNTILYGPPGTGKTYNTVKYAVAICDPDFDVENTPYSEILEKYNELKKEGRIAFTTFHQSYGYEEFIEGIKPVLSDEDSDDEESSGLEYTIESGLFKQFCERASLSGQKSERDYGFNENPTVWKVSLSKTYDNPVRDECIKNGHIRIGWDDYGPELESKNNYENGGRVSLNAFINRMRIGDIVFSCYSQSTIDAIGVITGDYEWDDSYNEYKRVRKVNWIIKKNIDIRKLNNGRNMVQSTVYRMSLTASDVIQLLKEQLPEHYEVDSDKAAENYVFIIDEINRGNISKVFGELITLIETTKRIGAEEEMRATLPYSGKSFGVPNNVYILGTMNTADRSIALMDTALRRRFDFKEMMPETKVIEDVVITDGGISVDVAKMLSIINERITFLYDREHTIGHAFFTKLTRDSSLADLADVFRSKVIPLLQEYFYEDYAKIQLVLGDNAKSDDSYKFILDTPVKAKDIFKGNPEDIVDLPEKKYSIQEEALRHIESFAEI